MNAHPSPQFPFLSLYACLKDYRSWDIRLSMQYFTCGEIGSQCGEMALQYKRACRAISSRVASGNTLQKPYLYQYFFAWRFWRYLWLAGLLAWAITWIVYLVRKYPQERDNYLAYQNRQQYIPKKSNKRKAKAASR